MEVTFYKIGLLNVMIKMVLVKYKTWYDRQKQTVQQAIQGQWV